jgi:outer membrane immunogenic protein
MTRVRLFAVSFAVAGAACLTTHARAGDLPAQAQAYKAPAIIAPSWTGFYIGINGGYGWGRTSSTITPNAAEVGNGAGDPQYNNLFPAGPKADGFVGGAQIGVNKQFDRVVAGLEADLSYADLAATTSVTGLPFIGGTFHTALESRLRWFGTVRGRLGVLPTENLLLYATGGVAFGEARTTLTATNIASPDACAQQDIYCTPGASAAASVGWALGGGAEYAISPTWSLKAEYLHLDFGNTSMTAHDINDPGGAIAATAATRVDLVRFGLNYKFN